MHPPKGTGSSRRLRSLPRISPSGTHILLHTLSFQATWCETIQGRNVPVCCEISTEIQLRLLTQGILAKILSPRAQHTADTQRRFLSGWVGRASNRNKQISVHLRALPFKFPYLAITSTQWVQQLTRWAYASRWRVSENKGRWWGHRDMSGD